MPTTTNFGWTTPADTDLVKDGALAIRTLGNGVDTSLVDLKGGTSGQALTKQTNTDLDYQWTDIIPASNTFFAAKNRILNSNLSIWQRGTSFSNPTSGSYTADRFRAEHDGSGATRTVSQQTFTPGSAPVAGYEGNFFIRYAVTAAGTSNTYQQLSHFTEDVRTLAGVTSTLSFWAKGGSNFNLEILFRRDFGSGGSAADQISLGTVAITTSWTRYTLSLTSTNSSVSGKTLGTGSYAQWNFRIPAAATNTLDLWGIQWEAGSLATAFQTATGNPQGELAACQRYYIRQTVAAAGDRLGSGHNSTTTLTEICIPFAVRMRTAPTALEQTGTAGDYSVRSANVNTTASAVPTFQTATTDFGYVQLTVASGLTAGSGSFLRSTGTAAYLGWSAEL